MPIELSKTSGCKCRIDPRRGRACKCAHRRFPAREPAFQARSFFSLAAVALAAAACFFTYGAAQAADSKPNIIFIMADDLGNADLGYRGGQIQSPNIDKLAQEGVRLESFYGQQVCTPSRAALMTGRYPMRYGLQTLVIFPGHHYGLPTDERTLPQALKEAGYKTLMTGKWHLGHADKKFWPQNRGFDYFYGNVMGEVDYFTRERGGVIDWQRNGDIPEGGGLLHDADRRRGGQAHRPAGRQAAVLPLLRLARAACALSGAG